jgi:hypothetical protein
MISCCKFLSTRAVVEQSRCTEYAAVFRMPGAAVARHATEYFSAPVFIRTARHVCIAHIGLQSRNSSQA